MQRFKLFYEQFRGLMEESLQARIDELNQTAVFGALGDEYIENKFNEYKERGVVPNEKINIRKSGGGDGVTMVPLTEKDYEEVLPFVLKMDKDVRDKVLQLTKGDEDKRKKVDKFYNNKQVRPVIEDAEQIKATLVDWLYLRNKDNEVPKSLRSNKVSFNDLSKSIREAKSSQERGEGEGGNADVDSTIPEGFTFIREVNGLRLYKWTSVGNACSIDPQVRKNWLSMSFDHSGDASATWCVAAESGTYRDQYGQPDNKGNFQYPYYLVRKNSGSGFLPYVLMHGNSRQCKDVDDAAISDEIAEEIYPVVQGMLKQIILG